MSDALRPFEPADGVKARWRYCDELVDGKQPDEQILYEEVEELLGCDRTQARQAMHECLKQRERDGRRLFETKAKFGWIVATAARSLKLTREQDMKVARAQVRTGDRVRSTNVDRASLDQFSRAELDRIGARAEAQQALMERRSRRRTPLSEIGKRTSDELGA